MKPKLARTIGMVMSIVVALMVTAGGLAMIAGVKKVTADLTEMGVGSYLKELGVVHILFIGLFLYPKTFKIGFILLCCYFGGAIATELSHGKPLEAAIPFTLICVATFFRDRTIFIPQDEIKRIE